MNDFDLMEAKILVDLIHIHSQAITLMEQRLAAIEAKLAEREKAEQALDEQPCSHGKYENCHICDNDE